MTTMPRTPAPRVINLLIFLACAALILVALYMQYGKGLAPCPLCMTQRIFFITIGVLNLIACLHNPGRLGLTIYSVLSILLAAGGGTFSSRQLWLQSLPADQVPACGPSLDYILETFPIMEALSVMMRGNGNCAEVVWQLFGISIPGYALIAFCGIGLLSLWQCLRR